MESEAVMADTSETKPDLSEKLSQHLVEKADKIKYAVLAVAIVIVAAIVIFSQVRSSRAAREAAAENRLFQSRVDLEIAPESDAMALFAGIAKDYQGLPTGARALILQFAYAYNTKDFAAAEESARDFIKTYANHSLANRARLGLGQALIMQGKIAQAETALRELVSRESADTFPEAKLALAQTLEMRAEEAKDDPEEHRRRLEAALAEYNDIVIRSQITAPGRRGYWPPQVTLPAEFSLSVIKDRLSGYRHPAPVGADAPLTDAEREAVMAIPPPADPSAEPAPDAGEDAGTPETAPATGETPAEEAAPAEATPAS